jgi:hypothetical protein
MFAFPSEDVVYLKYTTPAVKKIQSSKLKAQKF